MLYAQLMTTITRDLGNGWQAVMTWNGPVQGGPDTLTVQPVDPQAPPFGGISTPLLREIPLADAAREAREQQDVPVGYRPPDPAAVRAELHDHGVTERALARVAALYVHYVNTGTARPVQVIAQDTGRSAVTVRGWLTRARKDGLLTGAHGKLGGELTPKGLAALSE